MAKSKTDRKKQKRKARQKQVKTTRSQQAAREKGWFDYEEACYFFGAGNLDQALKFLNRAAKVLPNEEEVFQFMGLVASSTENASLELISAKADALSTLNRTDANKAIAEAYLALARKKGAVK